MAKKSRASGLHFDEATDEGEVKDAVKKHFGETQTGEVNVNLTKNFFRELSEELAARLLRSGHLKVWCVSCRFGKKTKAM